MADDATRPDSADPGHVWPFELSARTEVDAIGRDPTARAGVRVGVFSAILVAIAIIVVLAAEGFEPASLVFPGSRGSGGDLMVEDFGSEAIPDRFSYDGQNVYVVARRFPDVEQAHADGAADFRINRVLQAALASPAGSGDTLVLALAALGVVGVGLAAGGLADVAARYGRDPRVGYGAAIGLAFPAIITTSEPLAFGIAFVGVSFFDRNRLIPATCCFALAGLGRETALAFALAAVVVLLLQRRVLPALGVGLFSAMPAFAWSAYVSSQVPPTRDPTTDILSILDLPPGLGMQDFVVSGVAVALMVVAVIGWRDVPVFFLVAAAFLAACAIYIGDQYRFHGLIRVSSAAVSLGVAVLLSRVFPSSGRDSPGGEQQVGYVLDEGS